MISAPDRQLVLPNAEATARLGRSLAHLLQPGDVVLLRGEVGAGKTHLARSVIQELLAIDGRMEDVPSPTFTLVQRYETARGAVLHADLYRLSDPRDLDDIGLTDALGQEICLIEWPELLGPVPPPQALRIALDFDATEQGRIARIGSECALWQPRLDRLVALDIAA